MCSLVNSMTWKKYGNGPTMNNLIKNLLELENSEVSIEKPSPKIVKAGLALVVGDNLGQHLLGEMNSACSSGTICRFCDAIYEDVCKNFKLYSGCETGYSTNLLTEEKYNTCADLAIDNDGPSEETLGIKGHCTLNQLRSFHCVRSMPPCLGRPCYILYRMDFNS